MIVKCQTDVFELNNETRAQSRYKTAMDDDFEGFDGGDDINQDDINALEEEFGDAGDETNDKLRLQAATHYFIGKICDNEGKLNAITALEGYTILS